MNDKFIIWGTGGFARDHWAFLRELINKYEIKSVLEYGCGLSTELMLAMGLEVISMETLEEYADIPNANIFICKYPEWMEFNRKFDLAFVDIYDSEGDPAEEVKILKKWNITRAEWNNWKKKHYK